MPVKKRAVPGVQLSLEGTPPKKPAAKKASRARKAASGRARAARPSAGDAARLQGAVQALERLAESLHFTHESFALSLLRLPRAEDYEPLTEPLRHLAAATPALLRSIEGSRPRTETAAPQEVLPLPAGSMAAARAAVASARDRLEAALDGLPRPGDYESAARNLREMASVSPSLMAWLAEVPALSAPLTESVTSLRDALAELDRALDALSGGGSAPRPAQAEAGGPGSGVKVVVRG